MTKEEMREFGDEYRKILADAFRKHDEMIIERQRNISEETKLMRTVLFAMVNAGLAEEAKKILAKHGISVEEAIFGKNWQQQ